MLIATMAAAAAAACSPTPAAHRQIVESFYRQALIDKQPKQAFETYVAADFVEHKPDVAQPGREAVASFLDELIKSLPQANWEVLRLIADGDLVALHARFTPATGAPPYAIADFFRLKGCKIVEHWDVVAGPPKEQRNPNSRF